MPQASPHMLLAWAKTVTPKELEANIVMLQHRAWDHVLVQVQGVTCDALAGEVVHAAQTVLEIRSRA